MQFQSSESLKDTLALYQSATSELDKYAAGNVNVYTKRHN